MDIEIPGYVSDILETLETAGEEAYVVGGCVRDAMRGVAPHDWDVCTSALPARVLDLFEHTVPTGAAHGTVTVVNGGAVEVTTFRADGEYTDRRRPDVVSFVRDIDTDLMRRDFTVNAMAWSPMRGLRDPSCGERDLALGLLRAVGEPRRRFEEDALRILRGLRFSAVCSFEIESATGAALEDCRELLGCVAAERVTAELVGMLRGCDAGAVARRWRRVLEVRLPSLVGAKESDVRFAALERERSGDAITRLALLCSPEDVKLLRLRRSDLRDLLMLMRALHDGRAPETANEAAKLLRQLGTVNAARFIEALVACGRAERENTVALMRETARGCWRIGQLAIGGRELLELGAEDREVGKLLGELLELVCGGCVENTHAALLEEAARILREKNMRRKDGT